MPFRPILMTKLMLRSHRAPLTRTPADAGLAFEDVAFAASDGVALQGWFVPAGAATGPAIVFVHGWMWNRLGNVAGQTPVPDRDVDFLPAAKAPHDAGYHVLLFDLRGHGEGADAHGPHTDGPVEARDFVGAVGYLRARADVDGERIGAIGTSAGGNVVLYGVAGHAARQGRAGDPADAADLVQHELRPHRARPARAGADGAGRAPVRGAAGAAPEPPGPGGPGPAAQRHGRPVRPGGRPVGRARGRRVDRGRDAAHRRPRDPLPLDRALLGLSVHLGALGRRGASSGPTSEDAAGRPHPDGPRPWEVRGPLAPDGRA